MPGTLTDAAERWKPLSEQLWLLLDHIAAELPGCTGVSLVARHQGGVLSVLATHGVAEYLAEAQLRHGGPIVVAAATGEPVVTSDLLADDRWPALHRDELIEQVPELVLGAVALPGIWNEDGTFVLDASLDRVADEESVAVLRRYERLIAQTLTVADAAASGTVDHTLNLLASRSAIEQAKGVIIAARRCDPDEAWETLRRASQQFNVKLRELAVALVEHLAGSPVSSPEVHPGDDARHAAQLLWAAFTG